MRSAAAVPFLPGAADGTGLPGDRALEEKNRGLT